ncbi:semaphorin-3A-like [Sinocyclocheilus grahami]|uniref:semaphorin-3A-like n=1 Tax=Sinocyclocheilus grahami TaxID=75366 RepID=UPI0007AD10AA|nr:PREDICTED: semaphorin-3A-like [Sinocyclocheilus grahami]
MRRMLALFCLISLAAPLTDAWRPSQPRLHFQHSELVRSGRLMSLSVPAGDLNSLLPGEDGRRLYIGMKDHLLSASLDDITQTPRKIYWPASPDRIQNCIMAGKSLQMDCANFLRVLELYNQTHLYACGTGAFNPRCAFIPTNLFLRAEEQILQYEDTESGKGKCPYDPHQRTATAIIDGELYAGISSDFLSHDTAFIRSLGERHVIRTEQYDSTWLQGAEFVHVAAMSESDNEEDDKVYVFFTERAQEAEGAAGKVLYSRVARVCKNDIGGQRSLVHKWSTFQKARIVCSVPGPDGIQTHFDKLQHIFIQRGKDKKNPLIYGLFTTTSNVLNGSLRNIRQVTDDGNPLNQCVRQGAGLQVDAEEKTQVVALGNSTYLECLPKSHHATVTWFKDIGENSLEQHKVRSGEQLVVIDRGILIRQAELNHGGIYHCQLEEHGFRWTAVTVRLIVWSPALHPTLVSSQPWYQDVMALINHGKLERHCKEFSQRHNNKESGNHKHNKQDRKRADRHRHRGGGEKEKGRGRKNRSRMQSSAQRLPRSA